MLRSATFDVFPRLCNFAVERNFRTTLVTFVRFELAGMPALASVGRAKVHGRVLRGGRPIVQYCHRCYTAFDARGQAIMSRRVRAQNFVLN